VGLKSGRFAILGLAAIVLVIGCGSSPSEVSTFVADGGMTLMPPDDAAPIMFNGPEAGTKSDSGQVMVDACVGDACDQTAVCGDGIIQAGETCDDGNSIPGDGCSGVCQIEPGYSCPNPGKPCVFTGQGLCGDGKIEGVEACDDGNTVSGDGCSATCQVDTG
jgi:cysteine-rich repeat protein